MFSGISWMQYIRSVLCVLVVYYVVILLIYRKSLVQWWRERKN